MVPSVGHLQRGAAHQPSPRNRAARTAARSITRRTSTRRRFESVCSPMGFTRPTAYERTQAVWGVSGEVQPRVSNVDDGLPAPAFNSWHLIRLPPVLPVWSSTGGLTGGRIRPFNLRASLTHAPSLPDSSLCCVSSPLRRRHRRRDRQSSFSPPQPSCAPNGDRDQAQGVPASRPGATALPTGQPAAHGGVVVPGVARRRRPDPARTSAERDHRSSGRGPRRSAHPGPGTDHAVERLLPSSRPRGWPVTPSRRPQWSNQLGAATTPASIATLTTSWEGLPRAAAHRSRRPAGQLAEAEVRRRTAGGAGERAPPRRRRGERQPGRRQRRPPGHAAQRPDRRGATTPGAITTGEHLPPPVRACSRW